MELLQEIVVQFTLFQHLKMIWKFPVQIYFITKWGELLHCIPDVLQIALCLEIVLIGNNEYLSSDSDKIFELLPSCIVLSCKPSGLCNILPLGLKQGREHEVCVKHTCPYDESEYLHFALVHLQVVGLGFLFSRRVLTRTEVTGMWFESEYAPKNLNRDMNMCVYG